MFRSYRHSTSLKARRDCRSVKAPTNRSLFKSHRSSGDLKDHSSFEKAKDQWSSGDLRDRKSFTLYLAKRKNPTLRNGNSSERSKFAAFHKGWA